MSDDDEVKFVTCPNPECLHEQPDMGNNVKCDECGFGPMPFWRDGELIEPE